MVASKNELSKRVKKPRNNKEGFIPHAQAYKGTRKTKYKVKNNTVTVGMADIYDLVLLPFQNERQLAESTCRRYDKLFWEEVLPVFSDVEFAELTEEDIIARWPQIIKRGKDVQTCSYLLRAFLEMAEREGYTTISFWGFADLGNTEDTVPENNVATQESLKEIDEKKAKELAERGLRIKITMPTEIAMALLKRMMEDSEFHGELCGGIIMLVAGARTSEALAVRYKDLVEHQPGHWSLAIHDTQEKDQRTTKGGVKTENAPRWVPVPAWFAEFVVGRKNKIQEQLFGVDVNQLPIACVDAEYQCGVLQSELNGWVKKLYREVGGEEALWAQAMKELMQDSDASRDNEHSPGAYLLRSQFCTGMVSCGLSTAEIQAVMGHKLTDDTETKSHYANYDVRTALGHKMAQWGVFQMFEGSGRYETMVYNDPLITNSNGSAIQSQGYVEIVLPEAGEYKINFFAREIGEKIQYEFDPNIELLCSFSMRQPQEQAPETLYCRTQQYDRAARGWAELQAGNLEIETPMPAYMDTKWLVSRFAPSPVVDTPPPTISPLLKLPVSKDENPSEVTRMNRLQPIPKPERYAHLAQYTWAVSNQGTVYPLQQRIIISNRLGKRGEKLVDISQNRRIVNIVTHDPQRPAYLIAPNGIAYLIPAGQTPDQLSAHQIQDLVDGGLWIQVESDELTLVCLSASGGVVRFDSEVRRRLTTEGTQLVTMATGDCIVSACLCAADQDVLLVSKKGQALRIDGTDIAARKSLRCQVIAGIAVQSDDRAAVCVPYVAGDYMAVTCEGRIARITCSDMMSHGRGAQGRRFVSGLARDYIVDVQPVSETVVMVSSSGAALCADTAIVTPHGFGTQGVQGTKIRGKEEVVAMLAASIPGD